MSDEAPVERLPPPAMPHEFVMARNPDGSRYLAIHKRVDIRELVQIGLIVLFDPALDASVIGRQCCAAFDQELVSRPLAQEQLK